MSVYVCREFNRRPTAFQSYGSSSGARAVVPLRHILTELPIVSLKWNVRLDMTERLPIMREGKTMDDALCQVEPAKKLLEDLVRWTGALREARRAAPTQAA